MYENCFKRGSYGESSTKVWHIYNGRAICNANVEFSKLLLIFRKNMPWKANIMGTAPRTTFVGNTNSREIILFEKQCGHNIPIEISLSCRLEMT